MMNMGDYSTPYLKSLEDDEEDKYKREGEIADGFTI